MSKPLPTGWKLEPLRRLAQVVSGGTPSRYVPEFWEGGSIPWVTPTDVTGSRGRFLHETREHITELGLQSCSAKKLPPGTLLMTSRATLGEVRIALGEVCTNQGFKSLIPFKGIDGHFLYYQIGLNKERYKSFGIGSTFLEVNKRDTERFELLVAPEKEQRRIAEILSTLDEAIEQTEALIAKYQQIKAGLMQDLFTRGVTPDGRLRPTRAQAPHLYKDSPIGWIPKEWDLVPVEDLCSDIVDCPHSTPTYVRSGVPCIRTADLQPGRLLLDQALRVAEEEYWTRVARLVPKKGDVIYSREGERLGIASPVGNERVCLGQRVMLLRPGYDTDPNFLVWAMNTHAFYRRIIAGLGATTSPHVNVGDIRKAILERPSSAEQEMIGKLLEGQTILMTVEEFHLSKLRQVKHGLMHDLLTGRVRVKVAEPQGAPA